MDYKDIDNVLKRLQKLEKQGRFSELEQRQLQNLKFVLRYMRLHLKWKTCSVGYVGHIRIWVHEVKRRLLEPTRNGSMTADLLKKTFSRLLQSDHLGGQVLLRCIFYLSGDELYQRQHFSDIDVPIDAVVMDWLDPLLENLRHQIHCNDLNLHVWQKKQIKDLEEKLVSLRNFLEIAGKKLETGCNITPRKGLLHKTSKDPLTRVKILIDNAMHLSYASWIMVHDTDKFIFDLLAKINHIEPEIRIICVQFLKDSKTANPGTLGIDLQALVSVDSLLDNLEKLLKDPDNGTIIPLDAHHLAFLHQELSFLRYFLMDPHLMQYTEPEPESFCSLLMQVESMAREGASLAHSICEGQKKDDMAKEMYVVHSNLLEVANLLKPEIRQMYLRVPRPSTPNFPRTPKLGFLDFFVQNLEELLKHGADSIAYVNNEIETAHSELALLRSFIRDTINSPEEDEDIARRILDAAYEAERVIDLISASHFPRWYYVLWLSDVIETIKILRIESTELCSKKKYDVGMLNMERASIHDGPPAYTLALEEEVVGFNDQAEKIKDQLIRGPEELEIVSIVGMPGLGKTTLAKKLYEDPSVTRYFHARSWYCVSQVYNRRELLLSILDNVTELTARIREMDDEGMAEVLYRSLKGRRYLIVIDDIWSVEPWNDIRNSFPDDCDGSRILFTSRNRDVALRANPRSAPHDLRLFTDDESWELLQKKVFQRRNCPPELYAIGEKIARKCRGLPLSVVLIAGILKETEKSIYHWRQISESLGKHVIGDSRKASDLLELSYRNLPDHLKPCFLYFGAFPEDTEIPVWKLIQLWIAEGLVQKTESETLENVAEGYVKDLIARSLVLVAKNKCNGGVKSCRVHDLLHEFSMEKARDEKFFLLSKKLVNPERYRHCFCWKIRLDEWMPDDPYVRSMLSFRNVRFHCDNLSVLPYILKLLRVLDLERVNLGCNFPTQIEFLVHLRYLALRGEINRVPSSIANLWRLETFLLYGRTGEVKLPETLLKMEYLKLVYVNVRAAFLLSRTFRPEEFFVSSVQNLSTPVFCHGYRTTEKIIGSSKNLQKLKCIFLGSWDYFRRCNRFPVLDSLTKLESLNVTYDGIVKLPCEFSFPSTLKKLTLSKFGLPWSEISKIGKLPQLEVLKLIFGAFEGRRWDVSDHEFHNLKVLKLESLNIVEWDASPDAFASLEQLVLQRCKQLKEVPSCFEESNTLEMIAVQWCNKSSAVSVRKIQKELQDLRPHGLRVLIQPSYWD